MVVRETLKNAAGLIAFSLGAENLIHERMPEDFPRVTTRGHFDLDYEDQPFENPKATDFLPLSLIGEVKRTRINPGHDELDYGTRGEIPGFTSGCDESPDEIVVFVHGWLADEKGSLGRFSLMRHSLRKAGYEGPVIGFSWDTDHRSYNWKLGIEVAARNGPKLAQFVHDYRRKNPDTDVRLISNSLGARVVAETVRTLYNSDLEKEVETVSMLGGAVNSDEVSLDGRYGKAIEDAVGEFHNYWISHDGTLNRLYRNVEFRDAVGGKGGSPPLPKNYFDHEVNYVPDHFSYYRTSKGCIDEVVQDFYGNEREQEISDTDV